MELKGKVIKRDDDKFLVFGWASVAEVVDSQGDMIAIDTLENAAYNFVMHSRAGGEMHEVMGVATLVESVVFTKDKLAALGLKKNSLPLGWWVGFKVHDAAAWQRIKNGDYKYFSIGGYATREAVSDE